MAQYARDPRAYELMAILLPELADEDLSAQIARVAGFITDVTGSIKETLTDSPWGRRRLAYSIRFNGVDYRDGIYVIWHFDLEPSRIGELERELKLDTKVIRYLLVHDDPKWGPKNGGNQPAGEEGAADGSPATPATKAPADTAETPADEAPANETPVTETPTADAPATETETPADIAPVAETEAPAEIETATEEAPVAEAEAPVETEAPAETETAVEETTATEDAAPATEDSGDAAEEK